MQRRDAADRSAAAAGHRRGAGNCDRSGLPTGGKLRPCRRLASRKIRDAWRQYRPVLLDAHGGAVAQCHAKSGDGNAAHRRNDFGRGRGPHRTCQSRRRAGHRARRSRQARQEDHGEVGADGKDRQGSILSPDRNAARRGLPLHLGSDGGEHAGARRRGRHLGFHRKTRPKMGRPLKRAR